MSHVNTDIPKDWTLRKIKSLGTFKNGFGFPERYQGNTNEKIPFLKVSDINNPFEIYVNSASNYVSTKLSSAMNWNLIPLCSIIFPKIGVALLKNHRKINTKEVIIDNNMSAFVKRENINNKYLFYIFKELDMGNFVNISAVPSINFDLLKNFQIPITLNLKLQQQIANYLDNKTAKIDATIAKNEELIQLLEEKRVALINQVVTKGLNPDVVMKDSGVEWIGEIPEHWEVDCLKHNVNLNAMTLTDTTDSNYEFDYVDIGSVSLENGIEKYEHMLFEDAPSRARRIVKKDDVIISTVRTYLKAIAVIPDKENVIVSTGFAVLTPTKVNSRYLGYMVKSEYFTNLVSAYSVGVSYPAINSTDLVNLDILIPSDEEQQQIADYLDKEISNINSIINKVSDNIVLLEEYKTSLIHHVVTGKIDVRGEEI